MQVFPPGKAILGVCSVHAHGPQLAACAAWPRFYLVDGLV